MMTATLEALARQLSAVVAWRSIEGLAWMTPDGLNVGRVDSNLPTFMQPPAAAILNLSDPVTAAGLAVLARMARGGLLHAEPCHGRWVVKRWEGPYTADVLGEGATEVEAWASVILRGGG